MARISSFDSGQNNIDRMIDVLKEVQTENGIENHMRLALFDPKTNERINVFKRKRLEREGVDTSNYINSPEIKKKKETVTKNGEKPLCNIQRGVFVYSESDLIDESDERYICEYCQKIGFDCKYDPMVCDTCTECIDCREMTNGTCDGCGYCTLYNDGKTYGMAMELTDEAILNENDQKLMEEIREDKEDSNIKYPTGHFSILDH